jgi:hypothetical protein
MSQAGGAGPMTVEEARELLRAELLAAAAAVVPGQDGVVTHDPGPSNPAVLFDGAEPALTCVVTVQTGDPARTDSGADQVAAAAQALAARGWEVGTPELESGHHRVAATRDGFDVAVHAWSGEWRVTLTGETPVYQP